MIKYFKAMPSLTKFIVFSFAVILIYTAVEFITSTITGVHHDTLTTCFYACFSGEVLWAALIKIFKLKKEDKQIPTTMMSDLLTEDEINDLLKEENNANG